MSIDIERLQKLLCSAFCADISLRPIKENLTAIVTPFEFSDGDAFSLFLEEYGMGYRITDKGHTLMHLSYENDIDKFREGTRGKLFSQIFTEFDVKENSGEFFIETSPTDIASNLFRFGQALTKITDITFLNRLRVESTFYEDLRERISEIVAPEKITENYVPEIEMGAVYTIDYRIASTEKPLFLFGVPSHEKAQYVTIALQKFLIENLDFNSMIVFEDIEKLSKKDIARLTDVADEMVSSLGAGDAFIRKLSSKIGLN